MRIKFLAKHNCFFGRILGGRSVGKSERRRSLDFKAVSEWIRTITTRPLNNPSLRALSEYVFFNDLNEIVRFFAKFKKMKDSFWSGFVVLQVYRWKSFAIADITQYYNLAFMKDINADRSPIGLPAVKSVDLLFSNTTTAAPSSSLPSPQFFQNDCFPLNATTNTSSNSSTTSSNISVISSPATAPPSKRSLVSQSIHSQLEHPSMHDNNGLPKMIRLQAPTGRQCRQHVQQRHRPIQLWAIWMATKSPPDQGSKTAVRWAYRRASCPSNTINTSWIGDSAARSVPFPKSKKTRNTLSDGNETTKPPKSHEMRASFERIGYDGFALQGVYLQNFNFVEFTDCFSSGSFGTRKCHSSSSSRCFEGGGVHSATNALQSTWVVVELCHSCKYAPFPLNSLRSAPCIRFSFKNCFVVVSQLKINWI